MPPVLRVVMTRLSRKNGPAESTAEPFFRLDAFLEDFVAEDNQEHHAGDDDDAADDGEDSPQGEAGGGLALWTGGIGQSYLAVLIQTHQCILGQLGGTRR